jgi:hypothetical protein
MRPDRHTSAFSRRDLLRGAAATPSLVRAALAPRAAPLLLIESFVAGTQYYEADSVRPALREGVPLALRREPTNRHDPLAVEVFTVSGSKLGYVPRLDNQAVSRLMDAGRAVTAQVARLPRWAYGDIGMALYLVG